MILCCGEALIDMLPITSTEGRAGFAPHAGGSVFNTAIALGRLGADCAMFTQLSTDRFGDLLHAELAHSKVATDLIRRVPQLSTLAFVHLEDGHAQYSFFDENSAQRSLQPEDLPALPNSCRALFFGGISLVTPPAADAYATLAARAGKDRLVMLDPNIRPGFICNETRYRARLARMLEVADIVKISDADLDWLVPGNAPLPERARQSGAKSDATLLITCGAEGVLACRPDGTVLDLPAVRTEVVDTVGAGDTFSAGFLAALAQSGHLERTALIDDDGTALAKAVAYGARAAAITVSRAGANPPWLHEM